MKPLIAILILSLCSVAAAAVDKSVKVERHNGRIVKREARIERRTKKPKTPKSEKPIAPTPDVPPPAPGA